MGKIFKKTLMIVLLLALVSTLAIGCGKETAKEDVTIKIGLLNDMSGPAAYVCKPVSYALEDLCKYYNEQGLIPGVKLETVFYDTMLDAGKEVTGYEYLKSQGVSIVADVLPFSVALKDSVVQDDLPLFSYTGMTALLLPRDKAGNSFCLNAPDAYGVQTLVKWLMEVHWDYAAKGRNPKIGVCGTDQPNDLEEAAGVKAVCEKYPDKFDFVGSVNLAAGTLIWTEAVDKFKDCDYVVLVHGHPAMVTFVDQFRAAGGTATFVGANPVTAYLGMLIDKVGWKGMDGTITGTMMGRFPGKPGEGYVEMVQLMDTLRAQYRAGDGSVIRALGSGYYGGATQARFLIDLIREVVKKHGAKNFNTATLMEEIFKFKVQYGGESEWGMTETERYPSHAMLMYKFDDSTDSLVYASASGDWTPNVVLE